jgi:hypothetical protein
MPREALMWWVSLPYATFGLVVRNAVVWAAPPIASWAVGRSEYEVYAYYQRKGADLRWLP